MSITVSFPLSIGRPTEKEIYKWLDDHEDTVRWEGVTSLIFKDEEEALLFKLKFNL